MAFENILKVEHYLTPQQYVEVGNLSINTAMNRIKAGLVPFVKLDGRYYIDVSVISANASRRGKVQKQGPSFPFGIDKSRLVNITGYVNRKGISSDPIYRAILSGKLFGLVIAGDVFGYKDEIAQF